MSRYRNSIDEMSVITKVTLNGYIIYKLSNRASYLRNVVKEYSRKMKLYLIIDALMEENEFLDRNSDP